MQRIIQRRIGTVVFNSDVEALVQTRTASTVLEFLNQRTRWASKRGHYEDRSILMRLLCLFAFFLTLFAVGIGALVDSSLTIPFLFVLLVKMIAEMIVLRAGAILFKQQIQPGHFLVAELFHVPYIVFAALIGQFSSLRWKDRNLEQ
jgi:cellulose synthase/poly-beta-1,6-N-acetylglucosamine synthase-like glycosyltransferase